MEEPHPSLFGWSGELFQEGRVAACRKAGWQSQRQAHDRVFRLLSVHCIAAQFTTATVTASLPLESSLLLLFSPVAGTGTGCCFHPRDRIHREWLPVVVRAARSLLTVFARPFLALG